MTVADLLRSNPLPADQWAVGKGNFLQGMTVMAALLHATPLLAHAQRNA